MSEPTLELYFSDGNEYVQLTRANELREAIEVRNLNFGNRTPKNTVHLDKLRL